VLAALLLLCWSVLRDIVSKKERTKETSQKKNKKKSSRGQPFSLFPFPNLLSPPSVELRPAERQ
jgi:hypothetical protein